MFFVFFFGFLIKGRFEGLGQLLMFDANFSCFKRQPNLDP